MWGGAEPSLSSKALCRSSATLRSKREEAGASVPDTGKKKRDVEDVMGQQWGPELHRLKKACIGPPTILIKHTNDDARRFFKEMALGALDPQTLSKIGSWLL